MGTSTDLLMHTGTPAKAARELGNVGATLTGIGTTQTGGPPPVLTTTWSSFGGANAWNLNPNSGNTAYIMDSNAPVGYTFMVFNGTATTALIFPESGAQIQGGGANNSYSIAQNVTALFWKPAALTWVALKTA
jgi:hypothetical protein